MTDETSAVHLPDGHGSGRAGGSVLRANSRFIVPVVVVAVTFIAYMGTLRYDFVSDDVLAIVKNPSLQSWSFAPSYFTD